MIRHLLIAVLAASPLSRLDAKEADKSTGSRSLVHQPKAALTPDDDDEANFEATPKKGDVTENNVKTSAMPQSEQASNESGITPEPAELASKVLLTLNGTKTQALTHEENMLFHDIFKDVVLDATWHYLPILNLTEGECKYDDISAAGVNHLRCS